MKNKELGDDLDKGRGVDTAGRSWEQHGFDQFEELERQMGTGLERIVVWLIGLSNSVNVHWLSQS